MLTQTGQEIMSVELHVGSRNIFADAGFAEVSHPTLRRVVMRIDVLGGGRPVGADVHASAAGDGGDELERAQRAVVGEDRLAAAEKHRHDHEPKLVDHALA